MIEFLAANWLWIAVVLAMLAMHRKGGCGMHSHHRQQSSTGDQANQTDRHEDVA